MPCTDKIAGIIEIRD